MAADRIEVPFTLSWAWPVVVASSALACAVCYFAVIDVSCAQPLAIPGLCGGVGIALALACVIAPILCVIAWNRPLVLFALTAATAPTYNVFTVGYFGTLTKVCGLATVVALAFYLTRRPAPASIPRSLWAWLAFVAYAASTLLWAPDSRAAWEPLGSMLQLFALYAAVSLIRVDNKDVVTFIGATIAGGAIAGATEMYQYTHGGTVVEGRLLLTASGTAYRVHEASAIASSDPNHIAAGLLLPLGLCLWLAFRESSALLRLIGWLGAAIGAGGIYTTGSRGAALSGLVILGYFAVRSRFRLQAVATALLCLSAVVLTPNLLLSRMLKDQDGSGRLDIWRVGLAGLRDHLVFGVGIGNYRAEYDAAFFRVFQQRSFELWHRPGHNIVLIALVEYGIVGSALLAVALYMQFKSISGPVAATDLGVAFQAVFFGLLTMSLFIDLLAEKYVWLFFCEMILIRSWAVSRSPVVAGGKRLLRMRA
jgi:O-antigen ligase